MSAAQSIRRRIEDWLNDRPDDAVLRGLFGALLTATVAVLALDYVQISGHGTDLWLAPPLLPTAAPDTAPVEPSVPVTEREQGSKMTFELVGDGRLMAVGTIAPGTADAFATEIAKRGDYVNTIVLRSPGGSVADALTMGRLIRDRGFATEVDATCASSCPLVFAGGTERRAGRKAAIGVHQVFGLSATGATLGMDSGQRISAECQKYLREMDVDPAVWVHAMETPKERLYWFKPDELIALKLATKTAAPIAPALKASAKS